MGSTMGGTGRRFVFGVVAVGICLAVLEGVARMVPIRGAGSVRTPVRFVGVSGDLPVVDHPRFFWAFRPRASFPGCDDLLNERGFRGPDVAIAKAPGARRLVCVGDSCAFGFGVPVGDTYARRLERWLRASNGGAWDVVNLGVPGYSAVQSARLVEDVAIAYAADVAVLHIGAWNDFAPAIGVPDAVRPARSVASTGGGDAPFALWRLGEFGVASMRRRADERRVNRVSEDYGKRLLRPDGPRVPPEEFRARLREMAARFRDAGAAVVFVVPPAPKATRRDFPDSDAYARAVREIAAEEGALIADARAVFEREADGLAAEPFVDFIHPDSEGHRRIAKSIGEQLAAAPELGLGDRSVDSMETGPPMSLARALARAAGSTARPAGARPDTEAVVVTPPQEAALERVLLPDKSVLYVESAAFVPSGTGGATFAVRVVDESGSSRVVFEEDLRGAGRIRSPRRRVDLAEFAHRNVTLVFSVAGDAPRASWVGPSLTCVGAED